MKPQYFSLLFFFILNSCHYKKNPYEGTKIIADSLYSDSFGSNKRIMLTLRTANDLKGIMRKTNAVYIHIRCPLSYDLEYFKTNYDVLVKNGKLGSYLDVSIPNDSITAHESLKVKSTFSNSEYIYQCPIGVNDARYRLLETDSALLHLQNYIKDKQCINCMSYITYMPLTSKYQQAYSEDFCIPANAILKLVNSRKN